MRDVPIAAVPVFHIGEDLVEVARMERVDIVLGLHGVGIIFCVDDKDFLPFGEGDVTLHDGQKLILLVVQVPCHLRGCRVQLRKLFFVK